MPCDLGDADVHECERCQCQFEEGVAGMTREGKPRCPRCGSTRARLLKPEETGPYVVVRRAFG